MEGNLAVGASSGIDDFRWLLASATLATVAGALLIPTAQRVLARWVEAIGDRPSPFALLRRMASPATLAHIREAVVLPSWDNVASLSSPRRLPMSVVLLNTFAMAIWSVGVFAALYAGYLRPELRATAGQMSAIVNGVATILMFVFIDPYLSFMTDDVARGKVDEPYFRRSVVWLTGSRIAGTMLAQVLLVPSAMWIVTVAEWL